MFSSFFEFLSKVDTFFWGYVAFVLIIIFGLYLSIKTRFFQIRSLPGIFKLFFQFLGGAEEEKRGVHPLKVFFASTGGMIGIGNIVGISTAIQIGGPGALLWVWFAGMIGAIVKYGEIYLGMKFRVVNDEGGYDGGPMYFLKKAFSNRFLPFIVAFLICIYGVEIYQFSVMTESVTTNWHLNRFLVIAVLLGLVLYAALGGVQRVGKICALLMPFFLMLYILMGIWVIISEAHLLPSIMSEVFTSAFTGHAAVGGFAGSSVILTIQQGIARASYSSDIGIGYDSIIQSESRTVYPERQARLAILGVLVDNTICSFTIFIVLLSGVWKLQDPQLGSQLIQTALDGYFPYMNIFIPVFFIITGYTTTIAYLVVGLKCAKYLAPKNGKSWYVAYGVTAFIFFSYAPQHQALLVMSVAGVMLLIINLSGIFKLRKEISFNGSNSLKGTMANEIK